MAAWHRFGNDNLPQFCMCMVCFAGCRTCWGGQSAKFAPRQEQASWALPSPACNPTHETSGMADSPTKPTVGRENPHAARHEISAGKQRKEGEELAEHALDGLIATLEAGTSAADTQRLHSKATGFSAQITSKPSLQTVPALFIDI